MITQTPWFERKFDFNFPVGLFPIILERLRGTLPIIENITLGKPEELLIRKQGDSWSVKEHIGHLYDLEELWFGRIVDFLEGQGTLRAADLSNRRTHEAEHNKKSINQLLTLFSSARNKLVEKAGNMDVATVSLMSLHPRLKTPMRLIDSLFFVAEHDDHHLAMIRALVER